MSRIVNDFEYVYPILGEHDSLSTTTCKCREMEEHRTPNTGVTFIYIVMYNLLYKNTNIILYISLIPARGRSDRVLNAKTGSKVSKQLYRQAFGHDARKLV
jgi:hypothetical protein